MNRKIVWKFNIIDLIIIFVLVLSLFALVYKLTWGSADNQMFEVTYVCDQAPMSLLREIQSGDNCSDGDLGTNLGSVKGSSAVAYEEQGEKGSAVIKTLVEGAASEHGIAIGDSAYLKGKTLNLIIDDSVFEVYISNIVALE